MTTRAWYLGATILAIALVLHALVPRYEWRTVPDHPSQLIRIDRWSGRAEVGLANFTTGGRWVPIGTKP